MQWYPLHIIIDLTGHEGKVYANGEHLENCVSYNTYKSGEKMQVSLVFVANPHFSLEAGEYLPRYKGEQIIGLDNFTAAWSYGEEISYRLDFTADSVEIRNYPKKKVQ